jgi:hypothetical protein
LHLDYCVTRLLTQKISMFAGPDRNLLIVAPWNQVIEPARIDTETVYA